MNAQIVSEDEMEIEDRRWAKIRIWMVFYGVNSTGGSAVTVVFVNYTSLIASYRLHDAMLAAKDDGIIFRSGTGSFIMEIRNEENQVIVSQVTTMEARSLKISTIAEKLQADPESTIILKIKLILKEV